MHSASYYDVPLSLQPERLEFSRWFCKLFTGNYQSGRYSRSTFMERQQPLKHLRWHNFVHALNPCDVGEKKSAQAQRGSLFFRAGSRRSIPKVENISRIFSQTIQYLKKC